jgi:hypothetical protein
MQRIAVVALREFTDRQGCPHAIGECFDVAPVDAVILLNAGRAKFAPRSARPKVKPEKPKRRTYRRRDMTAEAPDA